MPKHPRSPDRERHEHRFGILHPRLEGIFHDLDGTLVDSEEPLVHGWTDAIAAYGHDFSKFDYLTIIGTPEAEKVDLVLGFFGIEEDRDVFYARLQAGFRARLPDEMKLMPGVEEHLRKCRATGAYRGLVTSATQWHAELAIAKFGLSFHPNGVVTAETPGLAHRKPHPAPYQLCAHRLHVKPFRSVVFEDSPAGAAAARAAGMIVVGVPHRLSPRENLDGIAHYILPEGQDIGDFEFSDLAHLLPQ